jgi:FeS assembly SUF system regulator
MLRISKLTDYGTMILVYLAAQTTEVCSANDVANGTRIALPTVQKLLKILARGDLVRSLRGAEGGYALSRSPQNISAAQIVDVLEGPLSITECSMTDSQCELEDGCPVGDAWQKINRTIRGALDTVTLAELAHPPHEFLLPDMSARRGKTPERRSPG